VRVAVALLLLLAIGAGPARAAAPLLSAQRTGGIAGVQDRLVVRADGRATVTHRDGERGRLAPGRTRAVRVALRRARLETLARAYRPKGVVNDGFVYVLRSAGHTVRVEEGAEGVPLRLRRLLSAVGALLSA
jgi:hypothetical protein